MREREVRSSTLGCFNLRVKSSDPLCFGHMLASFKKKWSIPYTHDNMNTCFNIPLFLYESNPNLNKCRFILSYLFIGELEEKNHEELCHHWSPRSLITSTRKPSKPLLQKGVCTPPPSPLHASKAHGLGAGIAHGQGGERGHQPYVHVKTVLERVGVLWIRWWRSSDLVLEDFLLWVSLKLHQWPHAFGEVEEKREGEKILWILDRKVMRDGKLCCYRVQSPYLVDPFGV